MENSSSSQKGRLQNNSRRASRVEYSVSEIKKLGNNVALFCLCESRHGKKIKKTVIVEHVLHGRSKNFSHIMKYAKQKLASSFGLSILDADDTGFIVFSKMENTFLTSDSVERNLDTNLDVVILKIALLAIIMNKGSIYESNLLEIIRKTGLVSSQITNMKNSEEYIKKILQKKFVERMLLEYKECERPTIPPLLPLPPDGKIYEYRVGIRAKYGIDKEKLRDYIADISKRWKKSVDAQQENIPVSSLCTDCSHVAKRYKTIPFINENSELLFDDDMPELHTCEIIVVSQ